MEAKQGISVLIPVYNSCCVGQVERLSQLCAAAGVDYEIIVADDGSADPTMNAAVDGLPHCRLVTKRENTGSAATRNLLAQEAQHDWLLFVDADVEITRDDFVERYLTCISRSGETDDTDVVNGGISVGGYHPDNLRWKYEKQAEPAHDAPHRQQRSYSEFRSTNFVIRRSVMLRCPFDERFKASGYEDVYFGRTLREAHVKVTHIDNPVTMTSYEDNERFMQKTERNLRTLARFSHELRDDSGIIRCSRWLVPRCLWRTLFRLIQSPLRRQLCGPSPSVAGYHLYRVGFYIGTF
ncbi:MAG: glycosyltransferase family 2 protein [Prevotella sp.]|nr:glycosyltransferase family 2 protein [Prevotella sp.]